MSEQEPNITVKYENCNVPSYPSNYDMDNIMNELKKVRLNTPKDNIEMSPCLTNVNAYIKHLEDELSNQEVLLREEESGNEELSRIITWERSERLSLQRKSELSLAIMVFVILFYVFIAVITYLF